MKLPSAKYCDVSWHRTKLEQRASVASSQGIDTVQTGETGLCVIFINVFMASFICIFLYHWNCHE